MCPTFWVQELHHGQECPQSMHREAMAWLMVVIHIYYAAFRHLEDIGALDPNNDVHIMWCFQGSTGISSSSLTPGTDIPCLQRATGLPSSCGWQGYLSHHNSFLKRYRQFQMCIIVDSWPIFIMTNLFRNYYCTLFVVFIEWYVWLGNWLGRTSSCWGCGATNWHSNASTSTSRNARGPAPG